LIKYLFVLLFGPVLIPGAALLVKLPELLEKKAYRKGKGGRPEGCRRGVGSALYRRLYRRRIKNKEKVHENGLSGYAEYKTRVKYRLLPFVW
jgi:protein-S-isoprenylcysteine O-methyltransferase Ste14